MSLVRNFATVGAATIVSRVLGFVRDILLATLLGAGPVAEAFVAAFRLPNLFRRILAEGALNAAFVPVYGEVLTTQGEAASARFAGEVIAALTLLLAALTAIAIVTMPTLIFLQVPGYFDDPSKFSLTVDLAKIMFPYLAFMSVLALLSGILNTHRRFAAAAFAPAMLNVVLIAVLTTLWLQGAGADAATGQTIAIGVLIGGVAQLLVALIGVRKAAIRIWPAWPRFGSHMKKLLRLMGPGILAGGITQLNIFIGTIIASAAAGSVSYLYYADRLYQLPLGVIGIAIGVVLLPELARHLQADKPAAAQQSFSAALHYSMALTLPAAVALATVPLPIVSVLFGHGAFTTADANQTASAVSAFAVGLPSFVLIKIFSPAYFAQQDTRTPMIYAGIGMIVNVVLAYILFRYWQHVGIAAATSVAGWVNAGLLWVGLRGHPAYAVTRPTYRVLGLLAVCALAMGALLIFLANVSQHWLYAADISTQIGGLGFLVLSGIGAYALLCQVLGALSLHQLVTALRRGGSKAT